MKGEAVGCSRVCMCVHPHDNTDENMHLSAQAAHIRVGGGRGSPGRGLLNNTFNVIAQ